MYQRHHVTSSETSAITSSDSGIPKPPTARLHHSQSNNNVSTRKSSSLGCSAVALVLFLIQFAYSIFIHLTQWCDEVRQLYRSPRSTIRRYQYWTRRYLYAMVPTRFQSTCSSSTRTPAKDDIDQMLSFLISPAGSAVMNPSAYRRLPVSLGFAFSHEQLTTPVMSMKKEASSAASSIQSMQNTNIRDDCGLNCIPLILACGRLQIPELILYDSMDVLSTRWQLIAERLAASQKEFEVGSPYARSVFVLQGDVAIDEHSNCHSNISPSIDSAVLLVYDGKVESVHRSTLMVDVKESNNPLTILQHDWRRHLLAYLHQHSPSFLTSSTTTTPSSLTPSIHLISFLGSRHGEDAFIQAALDQHRIHSNQRMLPSDSSTFSSSHTPSSSSPSPSPSSSPHQLRRHLQTSLLPIPLTEPDMLLILRRSCRSHRSLLSFPSWLLRLSEIFHAYDCDSLITGGELADRIREFGQTVQRGGI